jgi:hypothetical protein
MADDAPLGGYSEGISQLQNIARNLALWAQAQVNASPVPTSTVSPKFTGVTLTNVTATVMIASSVLRHGLILHNPSTTAAYVWPTLTTPVPTSGTLAGSLLIAAGSSFILPSNQFPNITAGWTGLATTSTTQAFTVVEFF